MALLNTIIMMVIKETVVLRERRMVVPELLHLGQLYLTLWVLHLGLPKLMAHTVVAVVVIYNILVFRQEDLAVLILIIFQLALGKR